MKQLPADVRPYRRSPNFTEATIPPGPVQFYVEFHAAAPEAGDPHA